MGIEGHIKVNCYNASCPDKPYFILLILAYSPRTKFAYGAQYTLYTAANNKSRIILMLLSKCFLININ